MKYQTYNTTEKFASLMRLIIIQWNFQILATGATDFVINMEETSEWKSLGTTEVT
jgi:hypothetical protein